MLHRRRGLESLELPGGIGDLAWLSFPVAHLTVGELDPEVVATLPASIETLRVTRYSALESLDGLPPRLERLWLPNASVDALGRLPAELREIELRNVKAFDPAALPRRLTDVRLVKSPVRDLRRFPPPVRLLSLAGSGVESLDGVPPEVDVLTLFDTRVSSLDPLPATLHALELIANPLLDPVAPSDLPDFLVELGLDEHDVSELDSLPGSLRRLRVRGRFDPPELVGRLPSTLNELELELGDPPWDPEVEREALCALPEHLESLSLRPATRFDPGCVPAGLRELYLHGATREAVRGLRLELETLSVTETPDLVGADLGSLPTSLEALELSYTGVRDLSPLAERLPGLKVLRCRGSLLEGVSGLPATVEELDLAGSPRLRSLQGLAASSPELRVLNLSGTGIESLAGVPSSVIDLDLRGTSIRTLEDLPPKLERLTVSAGQLDSLAGLPETVQGLFVVSTP